MKSKIFIASLLLSPVGYAKGFPQCDSKVEQIRLPGMSICVTNIQNPDSACLCNQAIKASKKTRTYAGVK